MRCIIRLLDPSKMRCASLRMLVVLSAILGVPSVVLGQTKTFDGTLSIVWRDPTPGLGAGGEKRYTLVLSDGRAVKLQLTGQESLATSLLRRPVTVTGQLLPAA